MVVRVSRRTALSALTLPLVASATGCLAPRLGRPARPSTVTIATGNRGGVFDRYGAALRTVLSGRLPSVTAEIRPTDASVQNVRLVGRRQLRPRPLARPTPPPTRCAAAARSTSRSTWSRWRVPTTASCTSWSATTPASGPPRTCAAAGSASARPAPAPGSSRGGCCSRPGSAWPTSRSRRSPSRPRPRRCATGGSRRSSSSAACPTGGAALSREHPIRLVELDRVGARRWSTPTVRSTSAGPIPASTYDLPGAVDTVSVQELHPGRPGACPRTWPTRSPG